MVQFNIGKEVPLIPILLISLTPSRCGSVDLPEEMGICPGCIWSTGLIAASSRRKHIILYRGGRKIMSCYCSITITAGFSRTRQVD